MKWSRFLRHLTLLISELLDAGLSLFLYRYASLYGSKIKLFNNQGMKLIVCYMFVTAPQKNTDKVHSAGDVWVLVLRKVSPSDSGVYLCEVNDEPVVRSYHKLNGLLNLIKWWIYNVWRVLKFNYDPCSVTQRISSTWEHYSRNLFNTLQRSSVGTWTQLYRLLHKQ